MYQSTSVAAAWDCLRRGDVNGAVGASAASRASSSGTSATGRVTDVAASRRRRCSASQCRLLLAKTQSSHNAPTTARPQQTPRMINASRWSFVITTSRRLRRAPEIRLCVEHSQNQWMQLLISHGADVNYKYFYDRDPDDDYACKALDMAFYKNNAESARLLLDSGANISRLNSSAWARILAHPRLLRIVLAAGADFTASCVDGMTPEDSARASIAAVRSYNSNRAAIFEETASILEGVRLAGSYKQYVLQDYKYLLRVRSLLARETGIEFETATESDLRRAAPGAPDDLARPELLDWLFATRLQPALPKGCLTVVHDFPACQAALARLKPGQPDWAERFEVFAGPVELANGYRELTDPVEQRRRFDQDNLRRRELGRNAMPIDDDLLRAMALGLPECSGVALGVDRLMMIALGIDDIARIRPIAS